ncbi:Acetyltransferase (GNAT) domain-containing protein [Flavobacterium fluvii]|uniref:Acetyltransferase (GNAT) domain-containing protein n=1 Tax=Flavobacterium fluvii TaxID=468056 RepID=A0A1M5GAF9_9FLAO|nr:GNAT family N-acetyltransferase [Flavobacterium fluvii]SHG00800.1 Acetyltransferase (GNAT) domain-containing protein [Flavobacterium fluvii]
MKPPLSIKIYSSAADLPENWNDLALDNIFLSKEYLEILEKSAPINMICHFIGLFQDHELVGTALSQFLDLNKMDSFGERDRCLKTTARNLLFKNFCSHILIIGNNMLTGQNAFSFSGKIDKIQGLQVLKTASKKLEIIFKNKGLKVHITTFKDFEMEETAAFQQAGFRNHFQYSTQPNMLFDIPNQWRSEQDYIEALSKKYRDQYKRARKKADGVEKRKMHLEDIVKHEETIYDLYHHVAKNAHFNTFFLSKNHFRTFKEVLQDKFLFYGYFLDDKLIGFNTLIKNGAVMDTYFLGYDDSVQREKMLYLNMLYDMIAYSINKGFKEIIFARTALEIKSSIGAKPMKMYGYAQHSNPIADLAFEKVFSYLEPKVAWKERNPFK